MHVLRKSIVSILLVSAAFSVLPSAGAEEAKYSCLAQMKTGPQEIRVFTASSLEDAYKQAKEVFPGDYIIGYVSCKKL